MKRLTVICIAAAAPALASCANMGDRGEETLSGGALGAAGGAALGALGGAPALGAAAGGAAGLAAGAF